MCVTCASVGRADFTLESLKKDGFEAMFVGIGLPEPKVIPAFKGLTEQQVSSLVILVYNRCLLAKTYLLDFSKQQGSAY
jgi:hypothetical protein